MNYLQLVQTAARWSGTLGTSGANPATLVGVSGRMGVLASLVSAAWTEVQLERNDWKWMRKEFTSTNLLNGVRTYSPTDILGSVPFRSWFPIWENTRTFSAWNTSDGVSAEQPLSLIPFVTWRRSYGMGTVPDTGKPDAFAIDDQNYLRFARAPDDAYTLKGMYRAGASTLAVDADTPACPADFHLLPVYRALLKLINYDESAEQFAFWSLEADRLLGMLVDDQVDSFYT